MSRAKIPELKIIRFQNPLYDERGFYPAENSEVFVEWNKVIRVANLYWINDIALETDDYWASQCRDLLITYWVRAKHGFTGEIALRYGNPETPHVTKWGKACFTNGLLYTYVIWPYTEIGEPMYVEVKKRFWELQKNISYKKG